MGFVRLRAVELVNQIVKVGQEAIFMEVQRSNIMAYLMDLCEQHVWNNLLHIKTFEIWECIFKSTLTAEQKFAVLKNSGAIESALNIASTTSIKYDTGRTSRKGNMAFAVKLSNLFKA